MNLQLFAERNQPATPKRRREARNKGQIPLSRELVGGVSLLAGVLVIGFSAQSWLQTNESLLTTALSAIGHVQTASGMLSLLDSLSRQALSAIILPVLLLVVLAVVTTMAQTGLFLRLSALVPDVTRISPLQGLRRQFSLSSILEGAKSLLKLGMMVVLLIVALPTLVIQGEGWVTLTVPTAAMAVMNILRQQVQVLAAALLVLAVADGVITRIRYESNLRMTRAEIREEMRESEGSPEVRRRIRQEQRRRARRRMLHDVPKANVVVTNPTHLAVALQYDPSTMKAPTVLAKGRDLVAARIRLVAQEHHIPIVENPPLAQALFRHCEIGDEIPPLLYQAAAELLATVLNSRPR